MPDPNRIRLLVPRREEWEQHLDAKKQESVLFCPGPGAPATGTRVTVDVVFAGGPRFLVRGRVIWRRQSTDRRMQAGMGVEVEPQYERTLRYISGFSLGDISERRIHPRLPIRLRVTYGVHGRRRMNFTRDLSASGLYIHSVQPIGDNEPVQIGIVPPSGSSPVPLVGHVARREEELDQTGMAIRFEFVDGPSQARFAAFVEELARQMEKGQLPEEFFSLG